MASGTPILLGVQGVSADLIQSIGCGLTFHPEDPVDLCDKLIRLKNDPQSTLNMGKAGRAHVERFYDRDRLAQDYLELISDLMNRN